MKTNKSMVKEKLQNLVGFIENMQAIAMNPYSAGLKSNDLLKDLKDYVNETIAMVDDLEEVSEDFIGEPDANEAEK